MKKKLPLWNVHLEFEKVKMKRYNRVMKYEVEYFPPKNKRFPFQNILLAHKHICKPLHDQLTQKIMAHSLFTESKGLIEYYFTYYSDRIIKNPHSFVSCVLKRWQNNIMIIFSLCSLSDDMSEENLP